jgi:hypothetical protein
MIKEYRDLRKTKAGRSEFGYSTFFRYRKPSHNPEWSLRCRVRCVSANKRTSGRTVAFPKPELLAGKPEEKW